MAERNGYVVYDRKTDLNTREITEKDWAMIGVEHKRVFWGPVNNWKVSASDISDEAWPYIEADAGLRYEPEVNDDDGASVPEPKARGSRKPRTSDS